MSPEDIPDDWIKGMRAPQAGQQGQTVGTPFDLHTQTTGPHPGRRPPERVLNRSAVLLTCT